MTRSSAKRVCLLTGAGGKLGQAFCRLYRTKYDIAAVYRRRPPDVPSQARALVDPLSPEAASDGDEHAVFSIQADLLDDRQIQRVVELTLARFDRIDLLVNAAANVAFLGSTLYADQMIDRIREQINLNTVVPVALASSVARSFWRDRRDENVAMNRGVVNVSSISGLEVFADCGQAIYSASKAALDYATVHMAHDFKAIGVRANVLAPGGFPKGVPTECVAEMIARIDSERVNGMIGVIDGSGDRFIEISRRGPP